MKSFIIKAIKSMGVSLILKEHEVKSFLTYYRVDFRDKFGNYLVFESFYNNTDVFTRDLKFLGTGRDYSLSDSLRSMCKIVGTSIKDYKNYSSVLFTEEELDEYFSSKLSEITDSILNIFVSGFSIRKVEIYSIPTMMVFIHLNYKMRRIQPIKIFVGEDINYKSSDINMELLIRNIKEVLYV